MWNCRCECGTTRTVTGADLRKGDSRCCGCVSSELAGTKADFTGKAFGKWTVVSRATRSISGARWNCKCECGTERVVSASSLRKKQSASCGCRQKKGNGVVGLNNYIAHITYRAKSHGLDLSLTREEIMTLSQRNCEYCGLQPSTTIGKGHAQFIYNGIDRVDSTKGYVKGNVIAACKWCNRFKNKLAVSDFLTHVERIYLHSIIKKNMHNKLVTRLLIEVAARLS